MILNIKLLLIHLCDTNIGTVNTKDFSFFSFFFKKHKGRPTQNRFCEVRGSQTGAIPRSHFEAAP